MSQLIVQEEQIKNLAKEAILELVREQREVLYDALAEVIPPPSALRALRVVKEPCTSASVLILHLFSLVTHSKRQRIKDRGLG